VHESNAVFSTSLGERKKEALSLSADEKRELAAFLQAQVTALAFLSLNSSEIQPRRADERPPDKPSPASGLLPVGEGVRRLREERGDGEDVGGRGGLTRCTSRTRFSPRHSANGRRRP
jgi:hypothetical protein